MRLSARWGTAVAATLLALSLAAGPACAQDSTIKPNAASNSKVVGAGSGSGGGSPNTTIDATNGVAGTGLGKTPPMGASPGSGNSVKGPAGQGISNSTDTSQ